MKNILTTLVLISINICAFAQKTNNRGEYLVKSIHWVNAFTQKEVGNKGDKWYHFRYLHIQIFQSMREVIWLISVQIR